MLTGLLDSHAVEIQSHVHYLYVGCWKVQQHRESGEEWIGCLRLEPSDNQH